MEGAGSIEGMALQVGRQLLMAEGVHGRKLASGAVFTPSLEVGVRNGTGDGETGTGIAVGGALRYGNPASRLGVEGRVRTLVIHGGDAGPLAGTPHGARTLVIHGGDTRETGVSGLRCIAPHALGHGLAVSVEPGWGRTASSGQQLWGRGRGAGTAGSNQAHLNGDVGHGFDAPQDLGGVVAPCTGPGLTDNGSRWWPMGARWPMAGDRSLSLEGIRRQAARDDGTEHGLMLRGSLGW